MSSDNLTEAMQAHPGRRWTAEDIRAEHESAMASFKPIQARALARLNRAFRESHLGGRSARDAMEQVYEEEALERNHRRAVNRAGPSTGDAG